MPSLIGNKPNQVPTNADLGRQAFLDVPQSGDSLNPMGYVTGAGGAVTQATSKSTGVTINRPSGQITVNNAALASGAVVSFTVTNSCVRTTDNIVLTMRQDGTTNLANYQVWALAAIADGSFVICLRNIGGASLSESPIINFAVVKSVAA
jgi:hypothetical protein